MKSSAYLIAFGFLVSLFFPALVGFDRSFMNLAVTELIFVALAVSWSNIAYFGYVSLGNAAFFGLGAYISVLMSMQTGLSPFVTMILAACITLIVFACLAPVFLRLSPGYYAVGSLVLPALMTSIFINIEQTGGAYGIWGIPPYSTIRLGQMVIDFHLIGAPHFYLALSIAVAAICATYVLRKSRWGMGMLAIKGDEQAAEMSAIDSLACKSAGYYVCVFFTSLTGAFYAHYVSYIDPTAAFSGVFSFSPMIYSLFGGSSYLFGPVIGTIVLLSLDQRLFSPLLPAAHDLLYGPLLVLVILLMPQGVSGYLSKQRDTLRLWISRLVWKRTWGTRFA